MGRATGVVSVTSCWKLPPCPAGPVRNDGNTSGITCLRKEKKSYGTDVIECMEEGDENVGEELKS